MARVFARHESHIHVVHLEYNNDRDGNQKSCKKRICGSEYEKRGIV